MNCPGLIAKLTILQTHAKNLRDEIFKIRIQERLRSISSEVREELREKWNQKKIEIDSLLAALSTAQNNIKQEYEEALTKLKFNELMELLQLDSQYNSEIQMQMERKGKVRGSKAENFEEKVIDVGWIEKRDDGTLFYKDYRWKLAKPEEDKSQFEHTLPDYKESFMNWVQKLGEGNIMKGIRILKKKHSQGFTHLLYRCTGVELQRLYEQTEALLIEAIESVNLGLYFPGQPLIRSKHDRGETIVKLHHKKACFFEFGYTDDGEHNEEGGGILDVDIRGDLICNPKQFDENDHGGQTFAEYVQTTNPFQWSLVIPEGNPLKSTDSATKDFIGDRKQIRTNKSPNEYLKEVTFQGAYTYESWMTLHEDLQFRHSLLSRYGIVIDHNRVTWVFGSYIKGQGVPCLCLLSIHGQIVTVIYDKPERRYNLYGVRLSVK